MRYGTGMAAGLAAALLLGPAAAQAQAPSAAQGPTVTTGMLAALCAGGPEAAGMAGIAYCRGFIIGIGQYHAELTSGAAPRPPVFCLPTPSPTVEGAQAAFVAWAQANPQAAGEKALIGVMRWAAEAYPCPTAPARAAGATRR